MKRNIIFSIVIIVLLVLSLIYFFFPKSPQQSEYSDYESCINVEQSKIGQLGPASEEKVGAKRIDVDGNIWTRSGEYSWDQWEILDSDLFGEEVEYDCDESGSCMINHTGNSGFKGIVWGSALIDRQPLGTDYDPLSDISPCNKFK